jgi:hypothetical protein
MNNTYTKIAATAFVFLGLSSCMDFDTPSDEFTGTQQVVDENVYQGNADSIPYQYVYPEDSVYEAISNLQNNFAQYITTEYYLRGGKNGDAPGEHQYQYVYNLHIDNYAGFLCLDQSFDGRMVSTYTYYRDFCDGPYGMFKSVRNNICNTLNNDMINRLPELKAVGLLLFDYAAQQMVDVYGSVPYIDFKNNKQSAPFEFNPGSEIYQGIINNIDTINACFAAFDNKPQWYRSAIEGSLAYPIDACTIGKTIKDWRRFANSLKLRMAMRYVKYDAATAQRWAEEAVAAGVVESTDQEIVLDMRTGVFTSPLTVIVNTWNDSKLNANFESILASFNHPYLKYAFTKNRAAITNTKTGEVLPAQSRVVGIRAGLAMVPGQTVEVNPRCAYSAFLDDDYTVYPFVQSAMNNAPIYFIKVSEMEFLRAEGAIRGWNMGGDARTFYENGIRHAQVEDRSKNMWDEYVNDYLNLDKAIDYTYIDPMDDANNMASLTKIGVKWNDGDDFETKLEKIITQKYISFFPYGNEAWAEARRTGYPKMFPVLNAEDYSDGSYTTVDEIIRRIPLPGGGTTEGDADITNSGIQALIFDGGFGDYQYSPVFWDIPTKPNR